MLAKGKAEKADQRTVAVVNDTVSSAVLFQHSPLLWIEHLGDRYQLRRTKQGKLILTK